MRINNNNNNNNKYFFTYIFLYRKICTLFENIFGKTQVIENAVK